MTYSILLAGWDGMRPLDSTVFATANLVAQGPGYVLYDANTTIHKEGHQNWVKVENFNAYLSGYYYAQCVADTQGVEYSIMWGEVETGDGVYNFAPILTALNYLASLGKKMIIRIFWKRYYGATDPPTLPIVPTYIQNNSAIYGGVPGKGGIRKVYLAGVWSGWGAMLENPDVQNKFKAFLAALVSATKSHPALYGYMFDESSWSCLDATYTMPFGVTTDVIYNTMQSIYSYMNSISGNIPVIPNVNYLEGSGPILDASSKTIKLRDWCVSQGMPVGITDTFRLDMDSKYRQPVYLDMPLPVTTIVNVDQLSTGNVDAGLLDRMKENYKTTARLGADITVWLARGGASSPYWAAMKTAWQGP